MKVAIYSGSITAPIFIENLIKSLTDQGIKVYLFGKNSSLVRYPSKNIYIFSTPTHPMSIVRFVIVQMIRLFIKDTGKYMRILKYFFMVKKIERINFFNWWGKVLPVVNHLPDVFHIQWAKSLPDWFFLKDLFGVRMVVSLRGAHINYTPLANESVAKYYRLLFPEVDHFHAVSKSIAETAKIYGAPKQKISVVYTGLNINYLKKFKKTNWERNIEFQFISVGRHHWKKGYSVALSAIKNLLSKRIPLHYTIIARDEPTEEILYQIYDLSLNENVTLLQPNSQEEVYQKMHLSDCLLLPSIEEGIANVVLEAMAIGLPVISSDCCGMKEVIDHRGNGYLFRNRDVVQLTQTMIEMMNHNTEERKIMVETANELIEKDYNISRLGNEMNELYKLIY